MCPSAIRILTNNEQKNVQVLRVKVYIIHVLPEWNKLIIPLRTMEVS